MVVFDSRTVGTASGMAGTVALIGGMLFTLLIGKSADPMATTRCSRPWARSMSSGRLYCGPCCGDAKT